VREETIENTHHNMRREEEVEGEIYLVLVALNSSSSSY